MFLLVGLRFIMNELIIRNQNFSLVFALLLVSERGDIKRKKEREREARGEGERRMNI